MILYYAHSHGSGHLNYAHQFASQFPEETIVASARDEVRAGDYQYLKLPDDLTDGTELEVENCDTPNYLHYNPLRLKKITQRCRELLNTFIEKDVLLAMIDVSVEVAALCRVASVPYAYRLMPGKRDDTAHTEAYRGALFLFAYYPAEFESDETPDWIRKKTIYTGFITDKTYCCNKSNDKHYNELVIIQGTGGHNFIEQDLLNIHKCLPNTKVVTIGNFGFSCLGSWHDHKGYVDNIDQHISKRSVVVASCGSSIVSELLSMCKRFIAIPQERPFDEQKEIFNRLKAFSVIEPFRKDILVSINNLLCSEKKLPAFCEPVPMDQFAISMHHYKNRLSTMFKNVNTIVSGQVSNYQMH